jgi:Transposase DDE domain group 1
MPAFSYWPKSSAGWISPSGWHAVSRTRAPERVCHTLAEMIRFRALLIAAGYPDADDCDSLRTDPAFKMAVGRLNAV